jgi:hypothetical protein
LAEIKDKYPKPSKFLFETALGVKLRIPMILGEIKIFWYFKMISDRLRPGGCAGFKGAGRSAQTRPQQYRLFPSCNERKNISRINDLPVALPPRGASGFRPRNRHASGIRS